MAWQVPHEEHLMSACLCTYIYIKDILLSSKATFFIHTETIFIHTHRRWCQQCKSTASSSGEERVWCLAQGHLKARFGMNRCGADRVSTAKSGWGPDSVISRTYLSTRPLGYQDVWKGANKFELHTLSVDWSTESPLLCDRGIITNKHSTCEVFLVTAKSLLIEENAAQKSFLDVDCRSNYSSFNLPTAPLIEWNVYQGIKSCSLMASQKLSGCFVWIWSINSLYFCIT